jgi:ferredoxin
MKVTVDPSACEANGLCVAAAPDVFELADDDCVEIVLPTPPAELMAAVRDAVDSCPKQALRLVEQ